MSKRAKLHAIMAALATVLIMGVIAPPNLAAADLDIHYSIINSHNTGHGVQGLIEVRVVNTSQQAVRNVDLRLAQPGGNAIDKGAFQFGTIPARQTRVQVGRFVFGGQTVQSGKPILWRVDYDDSARHNHKQAIVAGNPDQRAGAQ